MAGVNPVSHFPFLAMLFSVVAVNQRKISGAPVKISSRALIQDKILIILI
jgi:hypothetical protein